MKKIALPFVALVLLSAFSSCEKDEGKLPNIAFKTGAGYTAADVTVFVDSTVTVGISASKAETADVLKTFNVTRTINGVDSSMITTALSGSQGDSYATDVVLKGLSPIGKKATYTFAVTNRDGLVNKVSLSITSK